MSVTIDAVSKSFGRARALDAMSCRTGDGVTGLLGPNGAGKTTLLRIVATVLAPDAGRVSLLGRDPASASERVEIRRRLGYLPQEPGFHRSFTAFDFVDYVALLKQMGDRRSRHDEVRRVLGLVGLTDVAGKRIRQLSGGMRRRVGVAQALLGDPDLVVLDEPTAGLDPEQRLRFRELLSTIGERHTVLLSTHQTEDVAALCTRIVVMDAGRALWSGTPRELAEHARGRVWLAASRDEHAQLAYRTGEGSYRHVGEAPAGAQLIEPTIEDGYLALLGRRALDGAAA